MIVIEEVSKNFAGIQAVDRCSFQIEKGQITGLIGPNGAGKTTLFNIIAGSLKPTQGRIWLDGDEITGLPAHQLFHRGLVRTFQIPREFKRMTVLENLMLVPSGQVGETVWTNWFRWGAVRRQEHQIQQQAEEVLEYLSLTHLKNDLAGNLSGGQKKLLELGRTMMTAAKVVLLDEPAAGVNRTLLGELAQVIQRLNQERGWTFCIIEHDLDLISNLCDHVVCMAQGRVLAQGSMDQIKQDPRVREAYLGETIDPDESQSTSTGRITAGETQEISPG